MNRKRLIKLRNLAHTFGKDPLIEKYVIAKKNGKDTHQYVTGYQSTDYVLYVPSDNDGDKVCFESKDLAQKFCTFMGWEFNELT